MVLPAEDSQRDGRDYRGRPVMQEIEPFNTPFLKVSNALAPCATMRDLSRVWASVQPVLSLCDQGQRKALTAMKDWYKKMIDRGEIEQYLETRRRVEAQSRPAQ